MADPRKKQFDIVVLGAGFAGSLTALGLQKLGYSVGLIEKSSHPRFAIGESSTPIADLILRDLAKRYDLPWLNDLSRYGSWQQIYPEISCGLKRGFSYYKHNVGQSFQTDLLHRNELLVAASDDDERSDTNWYRAEVDAFFVDQAKSAGIPYWDNTEIVALDRKSGKWSIKAQKTHKEINFQSRWLIDATGSENILNLMNFQSDSDLKNIRTSTSAIFSHFQNVEPWQDWLYKQGLSSNDYPYNPDHSALHHLLDEGWLWMLRFNNGITSAGLVLKNDAQKELPHDPETAWDTILAKYPSLLDLFGDAELAPSPGKFIKAKRLQRKAQRAAGKGWIALPHTAGFIDPLHSTGIAHSLSGVERILDAFENGNSDNKMLQQKIDRYAKSVFRELDFLDLLIDGCYRAMDHFELFHTYVSLYFVAAIDYEQKRINGEFTPGDEFLSADHSEIRSIVEQSYEELCHLTQTQSISEKEILRFQEKIKKAIAPYNRANLLAPEIPHMYFHTGAEF